NVCQGVDIGAVERQSCGDGDSLDFIRGDCDGNGSIDLADAVALLDYLFTGGSLTCLATADVNDDSDLNLADPGTLLAYLYIGGSAPPEPFTSCGQDPDGSLIACEVYGGCP
ncbi:MAG: dockerin type I domain-containing protein, partial [Planctomycetota bacterium]